MSVTGKLYGHFPYLALQKKIDVLNDDLRWSLHSSSYTPDQDAHDMVNDLTNELGTASGYTAGGLAVSGLTPTLTYTNAGNLTTFDHDDPTWSASTITVRTAVLSDRQTGVTSTEPLIGYQQSSADVSSVAGDWILALDAAGAFTFTVA